MKDSKISQVVKWKLIHQTPEISGGEHCELSSGYHLERSTAQV